MKRRSASDLTREKLRALLHRRLDELAHRAAEGQGEVTASDLTSLRRLHHLVSAYNAEHQTSSAKHRWLTTGALLITLVVISILLFVRLPSTQVELDLTVTEMTFVLSRQQTIIDHVPLASLSVSDLRQIDLPSAIAEESLEILRSEDGQAQIGIIAGASKKSKDSMALEDLSLPAGTQIRVSLLDPPRQYRILINTRQAADFSLQATVSGNIETRLWNKHQERRSHFPMSRSILMWPASDQFALTLTLADNSPLLLSPSLFAESLSFSTINQFTHDPKLIRTLSTIQSGNIYFESLNDKELKLRPGEALAFNDNQGMMRKLDVREDGLGLKFHGFARGMRKGTGEASRSLMPTCLEWIAANHALSLMWGSVIYLFGLILSLLRWWGATK